MIGIYITWFMHREAKCFSTNYVDFPIGIIKSKRANHSLGISRCGQKGRYNNLRERRKESELRLAWTKEMIY